MRMGPRISTIDNSLGSAERMNSPRDSPFTNFTMMSVDSPLLRSRSRTMDDHSGVSKRGGT